MLGKTKDRKRREQQKMRLLDGITDYGYRFEQTPGETRTEKPGMLQSMCLQRAGYDLATEQQQQDKTTFPNKLDYSYGFVIIIYMI